MLNQRLLYQQHHHQDLIYPSHHQQRQVDQVDLDFLQIHHHHLLQEFLEFQVFRQFQVYLEFQVFHHYH